MTNTVATKNRATDNLQVKKNILNKIKEYDRIIIARHYRPDGDAIGSTKGLQRILKLSFPEKEILVLNEDYSEYLAFMGGEDDPKPDEYYETALGIVVDTGTQERWSNKKMSLCKELVKIDHHIDVAPYGDLSWVEDYRAAACEMIVDFYLTFKDELKMDKVAATYLYTGLVTDSGRFRFREVGGETLRNAAVLLDYGIDTETLYANLYLDSFDALKFNARITNEIQITPNGVAYIYVSLEMQQKYNLSHEDASNVVGLMDSIKGSLIWIAFIETPDGKTRVRLRSRFTTINKLGEKYHGGGHECAAGAYVYDEKEFNALLSDADAQLKEYKETHDGWL